MAAQPLLATGTPDALQGATRATPQPLAGEIWKFQISVLMDGGLPRDQMVVAPHFQNNSGSATPQTMCTALANGMVSYLQAGYDTTVKCYLENFAPPGSQHLPLATAHAGTAGNYLVSTQPREIALCLSYYASVNAKRYRGRLFLPWAWINKSQVTASQPGIRPTAAERGAAGNFYNSVLKAAGNLGPQWVVASTVDKNAKVVSNWWVDDEWDIQRRRGLRGTARTTGAVP